MKTYFVHDEQSEAGPLSLEELKSRQLTKHTPVWFEGLPAWTTVEHVPELASLIAQPQKLNAADPYATQREYHFYQKAEKRKSIFINPNFLGIALLTIALIGWLLYNNNIQAAETEYIQQVQKQVQKTVQKIEKDQQAQVAMREKINEEISKKNKNYRNNWFNYIEVGTNSYQFSNLGGIYGLKINVINNTDYMLDEVITTVTYFKANGDVWKSIEVPISNIPAHAYKSEPVADVERGISVQVSTAGIISKKMHFCYVPGNWANNIEDPYFCK